jgi:hypothetical protein
VDRFAMMVIWCCRRTGRASAHPSDGGRAHGPSLLLLRAKIKGLALIGNNSCVFAYMKLCVRTDRTSEQNTKDGSMTNTNTNLNRNGVARRSTETKAAYKTTEFIAYVVILVGLFIASAVVDNGEDGQGFGAEQAWFFATLLTIGYMISRGLAKAGSREFYDRDDRDDRR